MTELKPCPFCGGRAISHRNPGLARWAVSCSQCDCKPLNHIARTEAEAITAWNTRADDAEIERLRRIIQRGLDAIETGRNEPLMIWRDWANRELHMPKAGDQP